MRYLFWITLLIIQSAGAFATTSDVVSYRLPNGLQLFVQEDHRAPVVVSQVWYKVGSSYEPNGITGISHALEHMMFKGTPSHGPGKFAEIVAANGGEFNAFTGDDSTGYYEIMAADKLPLAFQLEADRMRNLSLDAAQFAKEIQVVMEERRMRTDDNPQMLTYERFLAAANIASPYHHMPIGWMNDLQHLTVEDVRQWYEKWYAPNNALLVVVGDVKPEAVYQLALQYFGPLKPTTLPLQKPVAEVPSLGQRNLTVKLPAQLPWVIMGYNVPVIKTDPKSNDPYVLAVIAGILDGGNSGRFSKDLLRGQQLAADISVDYQPQRRLDSLFAINATPSEGHTMEQLTAAIANEIHTLQNTQVTAEELARVKAGVIANKVYSKDSIADSASEIGSLEAVGLPWQLRDDFVTRVTAVTPEQIQAAAKQYLVPDNLTIAELQPSPLLNPQQAQAQSAGFSGGENVH